MNCAFNHSLSVDRWAETHFSGNPCVTWSGEFILWPDFVRVLTWVHELNSDGVFLFADGSVEEQLGGTNNGNMAYGFRIEFENVEEAAAFEDWIGGIIDETAGDVCAKCGFPWSLSDRRNPEIE